VRASGCFRDASALHPRCLLICSKDGLMVCNMGTDEKVTLTNTKKTSGLHASLPHQRLVFL
jgi:hypothetical protein